MIHANSAPLILRLEEHLAFLLDLPDQVKKLRGRIETASAGSNDFWLLNSISKLSKLDDSLDNALLVLHNVVEKHRVGMAYE